MGNNGSKTIALVKGTLIDGSGQAAVPKEALVIAGNPIRSI